MDLAELTPQAIDYILDNVMVEHLPPKDRGFIENATDQWSRVRFLSDPQKKWLGDIWDRQP